ncbi:unnamed protein product [Parnassius apollo]|uniref:(apollo) hypothetical protein n=1 Tax=Parnassius apollo TaxID=110799 RepID=A0A8S3WJZ4_PARAO|nr:unnamed protein product [Parnassius apollo]
MLLKCLPSISILCVYLMLNISTTSNAITREKRSPQGPPPPIWGRGPPGHQPGGPPGRQPEGPPGHQPGGPPGRQPGGPPGHQPGGPPGHQKQKGKKPGKGNPHRDYDNEDTFSQEGDTDFSYNRLTNNFNYNRPTSNMGNINKDPQNLMHQNIYGTEDQMNGNTNLLNSYNKVDISTKNNEKITYDAGQAYVLVNGNKNNDKNVVPVTLVFQAQPVTPAS